MSTSLLLSQPPHGWQTILTRPKEFFWDFLQDFQKSITPRPVFFADG
jgi:hypothetical protein